MSYMIHSSPRGSSLCPFYIKAIGANGCSWPGGGGLPYHFSYDVTPFAFEIVMYTFVAVVHVYAQILSTCVPVSSF